MAALRRISKEKGPVLGPAQRMHSALRPLSICNGTYPECGHVSNCGSRGARTGRNCGRPRTVRLRATSARLDGRPRTVRCGATSGRSNAGTDRGGDHPRTAGRGASCAPRRGRPRIAPCGATTLRGNARTERSGARPRTGRPGASCGCSDGRPRTVRHGARTVPDGEYVAPTVAWAGRPVPRPFYPSSRNRVRWQCCSPPQPR